MAKSPKLVLNLLTHYQELTEVGTLLCDLSKIPLDQLNQRQNPKTFVRFYTAHCKCTAVLFESLLTIEIQWNETQLCKIEIEHE